LSHLLRVMHTSAHLSVLSTADAVAYAAK